MCPIRYGEEQKLILMDSGRTMELTDLNDMDRALVSPWQPPADLAAIDDREMMRELIDIFLEDGERKLRLLQAAADAGDTAALGRISHSLKGSALAMGALPIIELSRSIEESARSGTPRAYSIDAGRLAVAFERTRAAMLEYCGTSLGLNG